jgi:hypothetical protein
MKLGLLGLNSAFLHLADVERGGVTLHPEQLAHACGGNPSHWCAKHSVNLLATHHPHTWLDNPSRYECEIYLQKWFSGHLFGHMHEPTAIAKSVAGGALRRYFQAPSLFGTEVTRTGVKRIFGYAASRISIDQASHRLRTWPRIAHAAAGNGYSFAPDFTNFQLEQTGPFPFSFVADLGIPAAVAEQVPAAKPKTSTNPPKEKVQKTAPPWAPYSQETYVPRGIESMALDALSRPGVAAAIVGPPTSGKSMLLAHLVEAVRESEPTSLVLHIGLARLTEDELANPRAGMAQVLEQVIGACGNDGHAAQELETQLREFAAQPLTVEVILHDIFQQYLLTGRHERVVLVLDQWERVKDRDLGPALVRLLRTWVQAHAEPDWQRFRLLIAASGSSVYFDRVDEVSEFFSVVQQFVIGHLTFTELQALSQKYGNRLTDDELRAVQGILGGQPFLSRFVLYLSASGVRTAELTERTILRERHCASELQKMWLRLKQEPDLFEPLTKLAQQPGLELAKSVRAKLKTAGLVESTAGGGLRFSTPILGDFFGDRG